MPISSDSGVHLTGYSNIPKEWKNAFEDMASFGVASYEQVERTLAYIDTKTLLDAQISTRLIKDINVITNKAVELKNALGSAYATYSELIEYNACEFQRNDIKYFDTPGSYTNPMGVDCHQGTWVNGIQENDLINLTFSNCEMGSSTPNIERWMTLHSLIDYLLEFHETVQTLGESIYVIGNNVKHWLTDNLNRALFGRYLRCVRKIGRGIEGCIPCHTWPRPPTPFYTIEYFLAG